MLSLLLTATLVLGALLAALHLRSVLRVLIVLAAAGAGYVLLATRPFEVLDRPAIELVYEIDAEHAIEPGPDLEARAAAVAKARLERLGLPDVRVAAPRRVLEIHLRGGDADVLRAKRALGAIGLLELVPVDDDSDLFRDVEREEKERGSSIRFEVENAPLGPGKSAPRYYAAVFARDGEDPGDALRRLHGWAGGLRLPPGERVAFEELRQYDEDTATMESVGWRTYLLAREAILTGRHIDSAKARPDSRDPSHGSWQLDLAFTPEGAVLFEEATGRLIKRRFAIVLDGIVQSAPVIQSRIAGGRAVMTMGAGSLEEQERNAHALEAVLSAGALPAPLLLMNEQVKPPAVSPMTMALLRASASLLLLALVALGVWLTFRGPPRAAPPKVQAPAPPG